MTVRLLIASLKHALGWRLPGTFPGSFSAPPLPSDVRAAVDRFFDNSSLSGGAPPVLRVLVGGVCTGKTTMRRAWSAQGYVVVDASEVFLTLSKGEVYDFPSVLVEQMNAVGVLVAKKAVREKRHVVIEMLDVDPGLLSSMTATGYQVQLQMLTCDPAEAVRRNETRGSDSISAYFARPYHLAWLKAAITSEGGKA